MWHLSFREFSIYAKPKQNNIKHRKKRRKVFRIYSNIHKKFANSHEPCGGKIKKNVFKNHLKLKKITK